LLRIKGKNIAFDDVFLGGSSTWARTRDLRINRHQSDSTYHSITHKYTLPLIFTHSEFLDLIWIVKEHFSPKKIA
jgi:hypothetical protein